MTPTTLRGKSAEQIGDFVYHTSRFLGAPPEAAHRVAALFLEGLRHEGLLPALPTTIPEPPGQEGR